MTAFSIDAARERITDHRTRRYFEEVYSSYANGNYRSAVVMLWSVVVCDLFLKLQFLHAVYTDPTANAILTEIEDLREKNPTSPDWEWALVKKVQEKTLLLDTAAIVNLEGLRDHRHLSAHPVLTSSEALFAPTEEQCRSHIRDALDDVLTKPAIMSRKVFDTLLEDIEANQLYLQDDDSLKQYLNVKYWKYLTPPIEQAIIKSLWRVVFRVADARAEANRSINFRTLCLLYARHPNGANTAIQNEPHYFSELTFTGSPLNYLMHFLSRNPAVFGLLTEAATTPVKNFVRTSLDAFLNAWFLTGDIVAHIATVRERVEAGEAVTSGKVFADLYQLCRSEGQQFSACEIGILLYKNSPSYDAADARCEQFVLPYLLDYDEARMVLLLQAIEANDETYDRRQAKKDHKLIKERADQLFSSGWEVQYPNFKRSLS